MWVGGAWWLSENPPYRQSEPFTCTFDGPQANIGEPSPQELAEHEACLEADARHYRENKAAIDRAAAARERDYKWRLWSRIGAVATAPFVAGMVACLLVTIEGWIARGFKAKSN